MVIDNAPPIPDTRAGDRFLASGDYPDSHVSAPDIHGMTYQGTVDTRRPTDLLGCEDTGRVWREEPTFDQEEIPDTRALAAAAVAVGDETTTPGTSSQTARYSSVAVSASPAPQELACPPADEFEEPLVSSRGSKAVEAGPSQTEAGKGAGSPPDVPGEPPIFDGEQGPEEEPGDRTPPEERTASSGVEEERESGDESDQLVVAVTRLGEEISGLPDATAHPDYIDTIGEPGEPGILVFRVGDAGGSPVAPDADRKLVLGADDPEMKEIVGLLTVHGVDFHFAAVHGQRCHPGNAYIADSTVSPDEKKIDELGRPYDRFVFIECRPGEVPLEQKHTDLTVIDHHEEGDPGYSLGPADFWKASSLGQAVRWLQESGREVTITQEMLVIAAMDHCRQAAIRGECPGVTKEEVLGRRVASIAEAHKVRIAMVEAMIADFSATFQEYEPLAFGSGSVIDITDRHLGVGYSLAWLCAQTALDMDGLAALARNNESPALSDEKIMLTGHATPEMVEHFMNVYAPARGLVRIFGVPKRSYAGGYIPVPSENS